MEFGIELRPFQKQSARELFLPSPSFFVSAMLRVGPARTMNWS